MAVEQDEESLKDGTTSTNDPRLVTELGAPADTSPPPLVSVIQWKMAIRLR